MKEWRLMVFTLAIQIACGLAAAATACELGCGPAAAGPMRPLAISIFPLTAAGIVFSMAHLGRPWASWRMLAGLGRSRLSVEILLTGVFTLLALAYSGLWWMRIAEWRVVLGAATSLAGAAAVVAAARVYTVPMQPVWNSGWVSMSFVGASALLGGLLPIVAVPWDGRAGAARAFLAAMACGALLLFIAAWRMMAKLAKPRRSGTWWRLGGHVLLATVVPIAAAARMWPERHRDLAPFGGLLFLAVLAGVAAGRSLLYGAAKSEPF